LTVRFDRDGGSRLLRRLTEQNRLRQYKSGMEIIGHFLSKRDVDLVCVFSQFRQQSSPHDRRPLQWKVSYLEGGRKPIPSYGKLEKLVHALPRPRFEGYQARAIQKQSGFAPGARGWYLGSNIG
jgi:hypothetical protein